MRTSRTRIQGEYVHRLRTQSSRNALLVILIALLVPGRLLADDENRRETWFRIPRVSLCQGVLLALGLGGTTAVSVGVVNYINENWRQIEESRRQTEESKRRINEHRKGYPESLFLSGRPRLVEEAKRLGLPYIGLGIALDIEGVEAKMTETERNLLKEPQKNRVAIVRLFLKKFEENGTSFDIPDDPAQLRLASSFFKGSGMDAGTCRHKATVLAAVLKHYGIPAELEAGHAFAKEPYVPKYESPNHIWVVISDMGLVADPENQHLMPERDYLTKHVNKCYRGGREIRPKQSPESVVEFRSRAKLESESWTRKDTLNSENVAEATVFLGRYSNSNRLLSIEFEYDGDFGQPPRTYSFLDGGSLTGNYYFPENRESSGGYLINRMRRIRVLLLPEAN